MTVTGHKCESSLKTYVGITDENTKQIMSEKISEKIREKCNTKKDTMNALIDVTSNFELLPVTNSQEDSVLADLLNNDDGFDELLRSVEIPQTVPQPSSHLNVENRTLNLCFITVQIFQSIITYCQGSKENSVGDQRQFVLWAYMVAKNSSTLIFRIFC
jgi:hypothetical protein